MKKSIKTLLSVFSAVCTFSFFSCHDVIFDNIRKEVKLDSAKVSGDIHSIIRFQKEVEADGSTTKKDFVYVCNGNLLSKEIGAGDKDWSFNHIPDHSIYCIAADSQYLYGISTNFIGDDDGYNVPEIRKVWCYDPSTNKWSAIKTYDYNSQVQFLLFCTNAVNPDHRKAFFRLGTEVFLLDGTAEPTLLSDPDNTLITEDGANGYVLAVNSKASSISSAAWFDGKILMSSSYAITTNESCSSNGEETTYTDAVYAYAGVGYNVWYLKAGTSTWERVTYSYKAILSLAVTSDHLLIGTEEGIAHTPFVLAEGETDPEAAKSIPAAMQATFVTNAESTLSSYYEIWNLLVEDPSKTELESTIYATADFEGSSSSTSASLSNVGLWAYYPTTREWNRE